MHIYEMQESMTEIYDLVIGVVICIVIMGVLNITGWAQLEDE